MFSTELLTDLLQTDFLGSDIIFEPQINSTNEDAWNYFHNGNPEGTLVITNDQQHGRGRLHNKWVSTKGKSLTFSVILRPKIPLEKLGLLPLLTGVSIIKGIASSTSIQAGLKWPNDIMLNQKKMGGILLESKSTQNGLGVVIGIGLNINESIHDFPETLCKQVTSLSMHTGKQYTIERILASILNEFELLYIQQWDTIISSWRKYCIHLNKNVTFHIEKDLHEGKFQGISSLGHAKIQINGETQTFPAGVITL